MYLQGKIKKPVQNCTAYDTGFVLHFCRSRIHVQVGPVFKSDHQWFKNKLASRYMKIVIMQTVTVKFMWVAKRDNKTAAGKKMLNSRYKSVIVRPWRISIDFLDQPSLKGSLRSQPFCISAPIYRMTYRKVCHSVCGHKSCEYKKSWDRLIVIRREMNCIDILTPEQRSHSAY